MNKHILTVMKWLDDPNSVSQKERAKNRCEAYVAYWTACATYAATYDEAYAHAAYEVYNAAYWAAFPCSDNAEYWVNKYFETTGEDRAQYEKELEK